MKVAMIFTAVMTFSFFPAAGQVVMPPPAWTIFTYEAECLASKVYSRCSASAELGDRHFRNIKMSGAYISSEGTLFPQVTIGAPIMPKKFSGHPLVRGGKEVEESFSIEPFTGLALTKQGHRSVLGGRMLYFSRNWFVESQTTLYRGKSEVGHSDVPGKWINCEPLADVMHHVGRGLYAGVVSSCYASWHKEAGKTALPHLQIFTGPGLFYRPGNWGLGVSYEFGVYGKHARNYVAIFGSYNWGE